MLNLFPDPCHQYTYGIVLFFFCQFSALGDVVPFGKAATATASRGMLSYEDGVSFHWCLLAVVGDKSGCQTLYHEVVGMVPESGKSFCVDIVAVFLRQVEAAAET